MNNKDKTRENSKEVRPKPSTNDILISIAVGIVFTCFLIFPFVLILLTK